MRISKSFGTCGCDIMVVCSKLLFTAQNPGHAPTTPNQATHACLSSLITSQGPQSVALKPGNAPATFRGLLQTPPFSPWCSCLCRPLPSRPACTAPPGAAAHPPAPCWSPLRFWDLGFRAIEVPPAHLSIYLSISLSLPPPLSAQNRQGRTHSSSWYVNPGGMRMDETEFQARSQTMQDIQASVLSACVVCWGAGCISRSLLSFARSSSTSCRTAMAWVATCALLAVFLMSTRPASFPPPAGESS
jgi:hypothetical protein